MYRDILNTLKVGISIKITNNITAGATHIVIKIDFPLTFFMRIPPMLTVQKNAPKAETFGALLKPYSIAALNLSLASSTAACQSATVLSPLTILLTVPHKVSSMFTPSTGAVEANPPITAVAPLS